MAVSFGDFMKAGWVAGALAAGLNVLAYTAAFFTGSMPLDFIIADTGRPIILPAVVMASFLPGLVAGGLAFALQRRTRQPRRWFLAIAGGVFLVSLVPPLRISQAPLGVVVTLELMHGVAFLVIVRLLVRHMGQPGERATQPRPPLAIRISAWLTVLLFFRMTAFAFALKAAEGAVPTILYVDGVASLLAGVSAPLVALALERRPGFGAWVAGVVWTVCSLCIFTLANAANFLGTNGVAYDFEGRVEAIGAHHFIFIAVVVSINLASLALLLSREVRRYMAAHLQGVAA